MRRGGSAALSSAMTARTADGGDLPTESVEVGLDPSPILIAEDALVTRRRTRTGGPGQGAEGDAAAAFPALPRGLDLSLAGESVNDGARRRPIVLVQWGDPIRGVC